MATNTILKGSRILVTGVNSYLGSHIAEQLLVDDYTVRGTVRSIEKGLLLHSYLCTKYGETRFELTVVEDICNEAAFATALNGDKRCPIVFAMR
jgi:nucleoside-diphosphate-sugar epimerase